MNRQIINFCEIMKNIIHPEKEACFHGNVDWNELVNIATEHNLLALFVEGASRYDGFTSRPEYGKEMNEGIGIVSGQVRRTYAFLELYQAFRAVDLHPLVLKGIICRQLYGHLGEHRISGDEDILIRPCEYELAKKVLLENGYVCQVDEELEEQFERLQEVSFFHPEEKLHIELHLNPMGRENDSRVRMSDCFLEVFDDTRDVVIQDIPVRTMNHQFHFLFLILHAFKHFTFGGFGIRQLLDILLYQEQYGTEIDMEQMKSILMEMKAFAFWNDLIYIGNQYLGFELPAMREPNCPDELLEDMMLCGVFGNKSRAEEAAGLAIMRASSDYLQNKSANVFVIIWRSLFPSRVYMLDQAPYLMKRPWLLPIAWVKRWRNYLRKNRSNEGNLALQSLKISQRRMRVLKKYDLM